MKAFLFLVTTAVAVSASAFIGLDSHYGKVSHVRGWEYKCTLENHKNRTLDMKYVVFIADRMTGDSMPEEVQVRIDRKVRPGRVIEASAEIHPSYTVSLCKFLSRN
ncbi:hypothetical protein [Bdellovibrio sp. HCB337]|uniref:hypothetical protein n=1 Tax=Bdellovibrio sp. HCB337 TaxID=3394358 RepID=UPI0039A6647D